MNIEQIRETQANIIVQMAQIEGWKDYARQRLRELMKEPLFEGLDKLVKQKLEEIDK